MLFGRDKIMQILPHRDPFLMIDEVEAIDEDGTVTATKRVTGEEYFFKGHFPGQPIMPGVLIIEAMAQTGAISALELPELMGRIALLARVEKTRFRRQVVPGDTLTFKFRLERIRGAVGSGSGTAWVDGEKCAECSLTFAIAPDQKQVQDNV